MREVVKRFVSFAHVLLLLLLLLSPAEMLPFSSEPWRPDRKSRFEPFT
jgi:hypothetical protein